MILAPPDTLVKVRVCVLNHIHILPFVRIFASRDELLARAHGKDATGVPASLNRRERRRIEDDDHDNPPESQRVYS